jgi:hypothetical protein
MGKIGEDVGRYGRGEEDEKFERPGPWMEM